MAKQIADDEDNLKRRARRRLIGAVALTTVVVVVLPMLLDSEPKPAGQDIELRIPDKDKVAEFAPKMEMPSAPVAALPASAPVSVPAAVSAPVAASAPVAISAPAVAGPPAAVSSVAAVPQVSVAPKAPEHKAAPSNPEVKAAEKKQAIPQSGFVVQVGAFAKVDTAHQWQKKLNKQGMKTYTEKAGDKTRVRVGPYTTREAADKARHKIEAQGAHPVVVNLSQ